MGFYDNSRCPSRHDDPSNTDCYSIACWPWSEYRCGKKLLHAAQTDHLIRGRRSACGWLVMMLFDVGPDIREAKPNDTTHNRSRCIGISVIGSLRRGTY